MNDSERLGRITMAIEAIPRHYDNLIAIEQMKYEMVSLKSNNMTEPTPLQRLLSQLNEVSIKQPLTLEEWELKNKMVAQYGAGIHSEVEGIMNDTIEPTPLQRLIFHLDEASSAAFELQNNTELPMNMKRLFKQLNDYAADLMEYEDNLPTNND